MGNTASSSPTSTSHNNSRSKKSRSNRNSSSADVGNSGKSNSKKTAAPVSDVATRAQNMVGDIREGIQSGIKRLEEQDHPAAHFLDSMCGGYLDDNNTKNDRKYRGTDSFYSEDISEDDSRTVSEDETTTTDYRRKRDEETISYLESDYDESTQVTEPPPPQKKKSSGSNKKKEDTKDDTNANSNGSSKTGVVTQVEEVSNLTLAKPLASSFAKRCYFTKAGIGKTTQHYEGLTLTGNVVLMLASAMKLKGCPTICDEDLRRVEQTYPNQFSRLPDELLLSSGWRRISKYCHFSNKPIPDGVPFFHSKQRIHPTGGYYFLLAAAVGMVRPIDVEPLTRDTLVLLETDYPTACDSAPDVLIQDPYQWTLVDKFCFFSGGPINADEDVYYQADFDCNPIYMLAFLSPSLTPAELYKLETPDDDPGLKTVAAVEEVESVYDLTERDFDDLRLYHLGPCRALPQYILLPLAWDKVLPPHFLEARDRAFTRAKRYEQTHGIINQHKPMPITIPNLAATPQMPPQVYHVSPPIPPSDYANVMSPMMQAEPGYFKPPALNGGYVSPTMGITSNNAVPLHEQPYYSNVNNQIASPLFGKTGAHSNQYRGHHTHATDHGQQIHQPPSVDNGVYDATAPMDEAGATHHLMSTVSARMDPPEGEPPSLSKRGMDPSVFNYSSRDEGDASYDEIEGDEDPAMSSPEREDKFHLTLDEAVISVSYDDEPLDEEYYNMPHGNRSYSPSATGTDLVSPMQSVDSGAVSESQFLPSDLRSPVTNPSPQPSSIQESEFNQSSVMRGAQEYIRRTRQRRLELHKQKEIQIQGHHKDLPLSPDTISSGEPWALSPQTDVESEATWDSNSEYTSTVSGGSFWTDHSNNDRSSRRALILQMAKARMKNNNKHATIAEENEYDEEKKLDHRDAATDIDLTQDLD